MNEGKSFGQRVSALPSLESVITSEAREGKADLFTSIEGLLADVAIRALKGEVVVGVERAGHTDKVSVNGLVPSNEAILADLFTLEHQHARGAWFLPEKVSLKAGLVNLPSTFARYPRFAPVVTSDDRARVALLDGAAGVFLWAVLEPLFAELFLPFEWRGPLVGTKSREDQLALWASLDEFISALGLDVGAELAVMRYGGGWGRLTAAEQLKTKI